MLEIVDSYGNDAAARLAYREGAALANRSHWGLIRVMGSTRHTFLHNLTTADIKGLRLGQGSEAVFLTATARCIDLVTLLVTAEAIWLITSPERRETLLRWLPSFVFFNDDVQFADESERYAILSLLGPTSGTLLTELGGEAVIGAEPGSHALLSIAGVAGVRVVVGGGLVGEGYTLLVPAEGAALLWEALRDGGAEPMGTELWEALRVEQGRPAADRELTEEYNPLEAGLWAATSFSKGCYIGQEVVARLDTYQKLKQQLWGLRLSAPVTVGSPVLAGEKEIGTITSVAESPEGPLALAYLRVRGGGEGDTVRVGEATATVVELPFLTRGRSDS